MVLQKNEIVSTKVAFLADLEHELLLWCKVVKHEVILLLDTNESLAEGKALQSFQQSVKLIDAMENLNLTLIDDSTYLWGKKG